MQRVILQALMVSLVPAAIKQSRCELKKAQRYFLNEIK